MTKNFIKISTAVPLSQDLKASLEAKLQLKFGENRIYEYTIEGTILAGLMIQEGDMEYHYDLRDQIDFIMLELLK